SESCLLQYTPIPSVTTTSSLWFISRSSANDATDDSSIAERFRANQADSSFLFAAPKTASRFSYFSWAKLHTGFGQFCQDDIPRVSRTNGAGFDKPHWLFLKFSFRL